MNDDYTYPPNVLPFRRRGEALPAIMNGPAPWPAWLRQHTPTGSHGRPNLLLVIRMEVPCGRANERACLVEDHAPRSHISNSMTFAHVHSMLQEPHGGQPCAFVDQLPYTDSGTDARLYGQYLTKDGPREGIGEVTVTVRVESRSGAPVLDLRRTFPECNLIRDVRSLLPEIPETPFGVSA